MRRILGQPDALAALERAWRGGRLHHAWVFAGPYGVGKYTTAIELARILLDPAVRPGADRPFEHDPASRASRLIDAATHPDLHLIHKELARFSDNPRLRERKLTNIPIDLLREHLIGDRTHEAAAYRTPVEGVAKVFVIDEAELLEEVAQDALLKTLEEPPPGTYIILVTSRPQDLLPTIRSRCQHLRFKALDERSFDAWLDSARLQVPPADRAWVRRFAEGSPGMALLCVEWGVHAWRDRVRPLLEEMDRGRFPAALGPLLGELVDGFAEAWVDRHANASKEAAKLAGTGHLLRLLGHMARDAMAADPRGSEPWLRRVDLLLETERQVESNVNLKLAFESLAAQWAAAAQPA